MYKKLLYAIIIIIIFTVSFTVFTKVVNAESNLLKKNQMIVILKNETNIDKAKDTILKIHQVRITNIKDRDKEWSKMVNKMDLPNMENPFKNEFIIKVNRNTDINEIYNKLKEIDFVEDIKYVSDSEPIKK